MTMFLKKPVVTVTAFLAVILCLGILFPAGAAEKFPKPLGAVNDFANLISAPYRQKMNALAGEVLQKTGTSLVVVTLPTVGDDDPRGYANRLYSAWGIGKKGEDKGVLIFLALKERRIRIETGYGVEGILPDGLVGEILDRYVTPYLAKGDYDRGLLNAMTAVANVVARDAKVSLDGGSAVSGPAGQGAARKSRGVSGAGSVTSLLILLLVLALLLGTRQGRSLLPLILFLLLSGGRGGGGGGFGGFGGGFGGFGGGSSGGGGAGRGF